MYSMRGSNLGKCPDRIKVPTSAGKAYRARVSRERDVTRMVGKAAGPYNAEMNEVYTKMVYYMMGERCAVFRST